MDKNDSYWENLNQLPPVSKFNNIDMNMVPMNSEDEDEKFNNINNIYDKNINAPKKPIYKGGIEKNKDYKIQPKILFPDNKKIEDESELDKFLGLYEDNDKYKKCNKNDWKFCDYCEKRHGKDYFLKNISYCILCWSWLNVNDLDLESGEYVGDHNYEDVKTLLAKTYQMYENVKDKNPSSIYLKINSFKEAGILHTNIKKLLGFEQEKKVQQEYLIYNKSRKLNINYEKSILQI